VGPPGKAVRPLLWHTDPDDHVLLFEFFPAFVALVSVVVGIWLYVANRNAPDESAEYEQRRREVAERAAAAKAKGDPEDRGRRRPSMSA
jgi:hypothetical protein